MFFILVICRVGRYYIWACLIVVIMITSIFENIVHDTKITINIRLFFKQEYGTKLKNMPTPLSYPYLCMGTNGWLLYHNLSILYPPSKISPIPFLEAGCCIGSFIAQKYTHLITSKRKALEWLLKKYCERACMDLQMNCSTISNEFHHHFIPLHNQLCTDEIVHVLCSVCL